MTKTPDTVFLGGSAYVGRDLDLLDDAVVVVRGTQIQAAGPRIDIEIPADAHVIDTSGLTLLPGFIDAHVHIGFADPADVLRRGVTTVRDLAWPRDVIYPLSERSREQGFDGPLILTVGPMVTVEGGYPITAGWAPPGTGLAVASPSHASDVVQQLVNEGACAIKVALNPPAGAVLAADVLTALVDAAHNLGTYVTAHVYGLDQLERALDAGIDELAHMLLSPDTIPDQTIQRMVDQPVVVVPTLSIFPPRAARRAIENLDHFRSAGGVIVYGTDLGNAGPSPGIDATEVTRMEAAGMSVPDIVRSATVDAARWLRLPQKGYLSPGMDADVVLIDGRPATARELTNVRMVMREGRVAS